MLCWSWIYCSQMFLILSGMSYFDVMLCSSLSVDGVGRVPGGRV